MFPRKKIARIASIASAAAVFGVAAGMTAFPALADYSMTGSQTTSQLPPSTSLQSTTLPDGSPGYKLTSPTLNHDLGSPVLKPVLNQSMFGPSANVMEVQNETPMTSVSSFQVFSGPNANDSEAGQSVAFGAQPAGTRFVPIFVRGTRVFCFFPDAPVGQQWGWVQFGS